MHRAWQRQNIAVFAAKNCKLGVAAAYNIPVRVAYEFLLVQVLFVLSWRLGPVLAVVIIATAGTAALYKKQTKVRFG